MKRILRYAGKFVLWTLAFVSGFGIARFIGDGIMGIIGAVVMIGVFAALIYAVYRDARQCKELDHQDKLIGHLRERIRELTPGNRCHVCGEPAPCRQHNQGAEWSGCIVIRFTPEELAELEAFDRKVEKEPVTSSEAKEIAMRDLAERRANMSERERRIAEYQRRYREANKDEIAEYQRRYYKEHREDILAKRRANRTKKNARHGGNRDEQTKNNSI